MREEETTYTYIYAFKEMISSTEEDHVCIDTGEEVLLNMNGGEDTKGSIKAFLQNEGMKVLRVIKTSPLLSLGRDMSKSMRMENDLLINS